LFSADFDTSYNQDVICNGPQTINQEDLEKSIPIITDTNSNGHRNTAGNAGKRFISLIYKAMVGELRIDSLSGLVLAP
jgi:hypothetical protein